MCAAVSAVDFKTYDALSHTAALFAVICEPTKLTSHLWL